MLRNKKYIKHADDNTVEVISLSRLQEGIDKKEKLAETYTEEDVDGKEVEYLVEYPGMQPAEMIALSQSKASTYNKTGKIPYTAIVDPFTLEEIRNQSGGYSAKSLIEWTEEAKKQIEEQHGKPKLTRGDLADVQEAVDKSAKKLAKDDYKGALGELEKLEKKTAEWPAESTRPLKVQHDKILGIGREKLQEAQGLTDSDPKKAKTELMRLSIKFKGTEIGDEADKLLSELNDKSD
ncbi:MAG: hypothetical protein R3F30_11735 [Planctomycetota bacterium]